MHSRDALPLELKRHPGARRLVWSRAVENQLTSPKELRLALIEAVGLDPRAAGNRVRHGRHIEWRAQIYDRDVLADIEAPLELFRGNGPGTKGPGTEGPRDQGPRDQGLGTEGPGTRDRFSY